MEVKVGSARGSWGNTKPGDQHSGMEVSTQNYYVHSKGWRVFVCTLPGAGKLIAEAMKKACANNDIGYDQNTRLTLWNNVKDKGHDPSKTTKKVNTDCSALVRLCIQYALDKLGVNYTMPNFNTANEPSILLKSGYFKELTGTKYTKKSDYLPAGAVLDTKTKGHTVIVLNDGAKAESFEEKKPAIVQDGTLFTRTLRNGSSGEDVREMQSLLIQLGYDLGSWGCDGDFGDDTEMAVKLFQSSHGCQPTGVFNTETAKALEDALDAMPEDGFGTKLEIVGGNCYIRAAPNKESVALGVAKRGQVFYLLETSEDGWHRIAEGWVSGKYSRTKG